MMIRDLHKAFILENPTFPIYDQNKNYTVHYIKWLEKKLIEFLTS